MYRNQSIDLFCKSIDWFLYNRDFRIGTFLSRIFTIHRTAGKGEAISFYPPYHCHPLHRDLDISWVISAESSPLRRPGSLNRTWKEFTLSTFALVAAVVRRMLKTRVIMENICRVLLNLTKRCINFQRLLLPPNVHAVNSHIFSLVHQLRLLLALTFVPLPYLFGKCHDMYIQLGRVYLRDV